MRLNIDESEIHSLLYSIRPPQLEASTIADHVRKEYGLSGEWRVLGGEREQNFRLATDDGSAFVVKIASLDESQESLMFQCEALEHVALTDPSLEVPRVRRTTSGQVLTEIADADGHLHKMRILTFVPGTILIDHIDQTGGALSLTDLQSLGAAHGRLARSLQGFNHAGALRPMAWDISNGLLLGDWLQPYIPQDIETEVLQALDRLESVTLQELPRLRSQVIYHDFHESNVLVRENDGLEVIGVIDFGDMIYGAVAQDIAVTIASLIHWSADPVAAAAALVRGYQRYMPLEAADLAVLKDLVIARMILQIALVGYQAKVIGRGDDQLLQFQSLYTSAVQRLSSVRNEDFVASMVPAVVSGTDQIASQDIQPSPGLMQRREAVLGKTYTFYDEPLELVRGLGTKLYDAAGREYLDCYNNVANVGHCHPYVVDALARQASTLNTNSRYLHPEIIRLGERISQTLPAHLDTCIFVCTGSEANDLAVRMARAMTGKQGVIVTENSYHGNTSVTAPLSLIDYDIGQKPDWVAPLPPPNLYRGLYSGQDSDAGRQYSDHVTAAAEQLSQAGIGASSMLLDSIFDANGALVPPADFMRRSVENAKSAGALYIADEVQMGFGRSGTHMWGFQEFDVEPDFVTMGKPMGNGHPIAAVVTRREIANLLQQREGYFNTFGGNTVSAAVANATLDVLQGEGLQANAHAVGVYLKKALEDLKYSHEIVGYIHGRGLFLGVELVTDRAAKTPAKLAARWVRERMKSLGVLVASTGPFGNIIKIRPPLAFSQSDANRCLEALDTSLRQLPVELRS